MANDQEQPVERQSDPESIEESISDLQFEVSEEEDHDDDEFTLQALSQAYAEVVGREDDDGGSANELNDDEQSEPLNEPVEVQEEDDDAACAISPDSIVESILFVGSPKDVTLTSRKIASVLRDVSPKEVTQIVKKLNARYKQQDAAWRIETEKGNYRMVLDDSLNAFRDDFYGRNREIKLNQSSIDVLAVVAYHQPATRDQIDSIRGKSSGSILNQLVKRELLVQEKTNETPVTKQYRTTDRFLDLFGLTEIEDLPQSHEVDDIEDFVD